MYKICLMFALLAGGVLSAAQLCPFDQMKFRPSDNGSDTKAFRPAAAGSAWTIDFTDQSNADNYLIVDLGRIDMTGHLPGGYIEVDAEIDQPILRIAGTFADPARFWPTRLVFTGEAPMRTGRHTYRLYLDELPPRLVADPNYHLFLFFHDMGGESKGSARVTIHNTRLVESKANWIKEKNDAYRVQFNWRDYPELGQYYRGKYDLLLPRETVEGNPFVTEVSLNGEFEKSYLGDITWNYDKISDYSFAQPGSRLEDAAVVTIPEPQLADRDGGYYIYRKSFDFDPASGEKVYLRIGDLADTAEIFLNGERIGTQSTTRKRHEWVVKNGSRQSNLWGKPAKEMARFQHFERCGIPFPFDPDAMPDDDVLMLPIYTGQYDWDYVFDVTDAVRSGSNLLAIRLYGNPVRGYWIYKHTEDRTSRNISGIFGDVKLYREQNVGFVAVADPVSASVDADGVALRSVSGTAAPGTARIVLTGNGQRAETVPAEGGQFVVTLPLPADFSRYTLTLYALDAAGKAFDSRNIEMNGTVIEFRDDKLFVNGDAFVVRGINADAGIEWDNDRTQTRRQWMKMLHRYKNLGFNSLRMEGAKPREIEDALKLGLMIMPVYATGSCNTTEVALGNLDKPDHEFNTDSHKEMALMLQKYPNILIWNSGNENHATSGYNDKVLMDEFLIAAQRNLKQFDPAKRPVTYANLDNFGTFWFFSEGQDVLGYNSYQFLPEFEKTIADMYRETGKPYVFCEWGFTENVTKGTALRNEDVDAWERNMRQKLAMMRNAPGCIGGYLFAHHGELDDVRGREFLQEIMAPFKLTREGATFKFENQDVAVLRNVNIRLVSSDDVLSSEWADELKPNRSFRLAYPEYAQSMSDLRVEIEFETHRGLNHSYTRMVSSIK